VTARNQVEGVRAVLFDLDGTLADTAADLGHVLNLQRAARGLSSVPLETLRPLVSQGARGMLRAGFGLTPEHAEYTAMRDEFLDLYADNLDRHTRLFDGIPELLVALDARDLRWGIVTNKMERFTLPVLRALGLLDRAACVISGDTCGRAKPYPDPLLEAARILDLAPSACIYLGDDERDVQASRAACMRPIVAMYGYLGEDKPPPQWGADHLIDHPMQLLNLLGLPSAVG
jgi:N-acetyl-D-muramate 6-phosphate phosphatase